MQSREWRAVLAAALIGTIAGFGRAASAQAIEIERTATKDSFLRERRTYTPCARKPAE